MIISFFLSFQLGRCTAQFNIYEINLRVKHSGYGKILRWSPVGRTAGWEGRNSTIMKRSLYLWCQNEGVSFLIVDLNDFKYDFKHNWQRRVICFYTCILYYRNRLQIADRKSMWVR